MKIMLAAFAVLFASGSALATTPKRISIPSDSSAAYFVIDLKKTGRGMVEVTTKRERKSSTSYSKRLVDCTGV